MQLFLSCEEIEYLTGRRKPSAQIKTLKQKGFEFTVNAKGLPVLTRAHVEAMLSANTKAEQFTPNFGAIN